MSTLLTTGFRWLGPLVLGIMTLGCATPQGPLPAYLTNPTPQTMARVKAVLATAMGTNRIELGAGDVSRATTLSVLPPPLGPMDGRSLAVPTLFDIVKVGGSCSLVARADGRSYPLTGVACTVANQAR